MQFARPPSGLYAAMKVPLTATKPCAGPFLIGNLVAVGCRVMLFGPRLGTLLGTLGRRSVAKNGPVHATISMALENLFELQQRLVRFQHGSPVHSALSVEARAHSQIEAIGSAPFLYSTAIMPAIAFPVSLAPPLRATLFFDDGERKKA